MTLNITADILTVILKVAGMSDLEITKERTGCGRRYLRPWRSYQRWCIMHFLVNTKEINGYENGAPTYKANGTLAKAKFDVIDKKGVLTATSKTSVSSTDVQDGQIEIVSDEDDEAKLFDCDLTGLEDYLAQKDYILLQGKQRSYTKSSCSNI